jgi:Uma2 family endonuclease
VAAQVVDMLTIEERVTVPNTAFTHAGYRAWVTSDVYPEKGLRTTFVNGEVLVDMTPESIEGHIKVKTAVTTALDRFVRDHDLGESYADGTLVTNEVAGLSCEPDLTFVSWLSFESGVVRLERTADGADYIEVVGSPDLVVETVSKTSVKKDTILLRQAYALAGVREYWLIDARAEPMQFEILHNEEGAFRLSGDPGAPPESRVLAGRWQLTRSRNRVGRFSYELRYGPGELAARDMNAFMT